MFTNKSIVCAYDGNDQGISISMSWLIVLILLYTAVIVCHIFGIYLLNALRKSGKGKAQYTLVKNVSTSVVTIHLLEIVYVIVKYNESRYMYLKPLRGFILILMNSIYLIVYYLAMVYVNLDQLLEVTLNIRYFLFVTEERVKVLIIFTWSISILVGVALSCFLTNNMTHDMIDVIRLKFASGLYVIEILFMLFIIITYVIIFYHFKKTRIQPCRITTKGERKVPLRIILLSSWHAFRKSRFYITSLLIVTSLLAVFVPDILYNFLRAKKVSEKVLKLSHITREVIWIVNVFIYVYIDAVVKRMVYKKMNIWCCQRNKVNFVNNSHRFLMDFFDNNNKIKPVNQS